MTLFLRFLPYILGGALIIAAYYYVKNIGILETENKNLKQTVRSIENYEKIKKDVISLDDADLRRRYCRWVRDDIEACMQSDIPITP